MLAKVEKLDSVRTQLNVVEYLESNGYIPTIKDGFVLADWYSDTLKAYDSFIYSYAYKVDKFFVIKDYLKEKDKKTELVFQNGKLIKNSITPIEEYKIGDTLHFDVHYYQDWLIGYKSVQVETVIRKNNGKMVKVEVQLQGTDKKLEIGKVKEKIKDLESSWINPRYGRRKE